MMNWKKTIEGILSAAMLLSTAACANGGSGENSGKSAAPAGGSSQHVTIKFANSELLEQGYVSFWNGVKSGFEKKYPNYTIQWVTAPYAELVNQVINMAGGGNKADVIYSELDWTPTLKDAGLAVPVENVLPADFLADFYPSVLNAGKIDGKVYSLPIYESPFILYYNKDIFKQAGLDPEKPPKTYDEMLSMAEKISKLKTSGGSKIYPFGQTTASVAVSGAALTSMVYNFGGRVLTDDGKLDADNQGFQDAMKMIKTLDEKGYNPRNAKLKDLRNLFALGQLAMYYDQSWGFNGVQSINPKAKDFTASAAPLAGGQGKGESLMQSHTLIFMNESAEMKDVLTKLSEYLISTDVLKDYLSSTTPAYAPRKSMNIQNSSILKGAADSINSAKPNVFIPGLSDLDLELCTLAQSITVGRKSVDDGISTYKSAANAIINK